MECVEKEKKEGKPVKSDQSFGGGLR